MYCCSYMNINHLSKYFGCDKYKSYLLNRNRLILSKIFGMVCWNTKVKSKMLA